MRGEIQKKEGKNTSHDFKIIFFIDHICYYVQVIFIGGGPGGGELAPLKLIHMCSPVVSILDSPAVDQRSNPDSGSAL